MHFLIERIVSSFFFPLYDSSKFSERLQAKQKKKERKEKEVFRSRIESREKGIRKCMMLYRMCNEVYT